MSKTIHIEIKMYIVFLVLLFIKTLNYLVNNSYNNEVTVILWNDEEEVYLYINEFDAKKVKLKKIYCVIY